jgi:hypothetical protein
MIEQTELVVTEWIYLPTTVSTDNEVKITSQTGLDVMKKRNDIKKGIAVRLTSKFSIGKDPVLLYVAEHSFVIDFEEIIDKNELVRMFKNSFTQFNEKFDIRKLGTLLQNCALSPLDESKIDFEAILPLLV